jgi:hypothetical protein
MNRNESTGEDFQCRNLEGCVFSLKTSENGDLSCRLPPQGFGAAAAMNSNVWHHELGHGSGSAQGKGQCRSSPFAGQADSQ